MSRKLIYEIPTHKFARLHKDSKRDTKYFGIPMLISFHILFFLLFINEIIENNKYYGIPGPIFTLIPWTFFGILTFLNEYLCDFMCAFRHRQLRIYNDGLVPSIIPFSHFTFKDIFIPYSKITKIELREHPKFDDFYTFEIYDDKGKKYKVDSRWLYMYDVPEKDVRRIKKLPLKIKDELEKDENKEKKEKGQKIILNIEAS